MKKFITFIAAIMIGSSAYATETQEITPNSKGAKLMTDITNITIAPIVSKIIGEEVEFSADIEFGMVATEYSYNECKNKVTGKVLPNLAHEGFDVPIMVGMLLDGTKILTVAAFESEGSEIENGKSAFIVICGSKPSGVTYSALMGTKLAPASTNYQAEVNSKSDVDNALF